MCRCGCRCRLPSARDRFTKPNRRRRSRISRAQREQRRPRPRGRRDARQQRKTGETMTEMTAGSTGQSRLRVILAACIGSPLEWYDFFLYGTAAALVFGDLFCPKSDPIVGTLLAFLTFGVGFVVRPIGGILFGILGDRFGRKPVLVATLLMIGIGTTA